MLRRSRVYDPTRYARKVEPVEVAEGLSPWPKARGNTAAQKAGIAYERACARWFKKSGVPARAGVWLHYREAEGKPAWAGPDFVILEGRLAPMIVECKLTFRPGAIEQMENLYLPLAESLWGAVGRWKRVALVKRWHASAEQYPKIAELGEALPRAQVLFLPVL